MTAPSEPEGKGTGVGRWLAAASLALLVGGLLSAALIYWVVVIVPGRMMTEARREVDTAAREATELARRMAQRVADALGVQPRVTVGTNVVVLGTRAILELATAERAITVEYTLDATFLGSRKLLTVEGQFLGKAGFQLDGDAFAVSVQTDPLRVDVLAPEPQLLSVELVEASVDQQQGLWNRLTAEDHETALNAMTDKARRELSNPAFLDRARASFEERIRELAGDAPLGSVRIRYLPHTNAAPTPVTSG